MNIHIVAKDNRYCWTVITSCSRYDGWAHSLGDVFEQLIAYQYKGK